MEVLTVLIIPAIVKLVDLVAKKEWSGVAKIVLAALAGAVAGWLGINGLDVMSGIGAGLAASGAVTIASYAGKSSK